MVRSGTQAFIDEAAPASPAAMRVELELLRRREAVYRATLDHLQGELHRAREVQRQLLPSTLPPVAGLDVHVLYHPADVVGGDLYDVTRLDETRVSISLADATGHGLSAGMISALVKGSLRGRRRTETGFRFLEPDAVLARADRDLFDHALAECHFVTALYAVYDEPSRTLRWARGGAPYPILVRRGQQPRRILSAGPIVGACPDSRFEVVELPLEPGDIVVFYTDGLEALLTDRNNRLGCGELERTAWFESLGHRSPAEQLEGLETLLTNIEPEDWRVDDVTVVALHMRDSAVPGLGRLNNAQMAIPDTQSTDHGRPNDEKCPS